MRKKQKSLGFIVRYLSILCAIVPVVACAENVTYIYEGPRGDVLAEADKFGEITASFEYRPFGQVVTGSAGDGVRYAGNFYDADVKLVYMSARYYDPDAARFVSADLVAVLPGGVSLFNRFAYAFNNPVGLIDRSGMLPTNGDYYGYPYEIYISPHGDSEGGGGGEVKNKATVPLNTPDKLKPYFENISAADRIKAAMVVMDYFNIDYKNLTFAYKFDSGANASMSFDGQLDVAEPLFRNSFGMIGAMLFHEVGVHWHVQFSKMRELKDGLQSNSPAFLMREVQAYDLELTEANIRRFGLTPAEVSSERHKRDGYFNSLSPANKSMIEKYHVYTPL
ncbi:MAG TPA: RHS repeat-associated core domain-containing protein [Dyella sp.]|uniref:RHS repeat domain-containing protein n=1 Tax=Dyella sp. TaxID=1869338 RepID=UPI002F94B6DC